MENRTSEEKTLLIVDDSQPYLTLVCDELVGMGHRIETASTGKEAVSKIVDQRPSFVFLDFMLPDFDGVEVLNRLPDGTAARMRIVLLTAAPQDGAQWKEANARLQELRASRSEFRNVQFLPKPIALPAVRDIFRALTAGAA